MRFLLVNAMKQSLWVPKISFSYALSSLPSGGSHTPFATVEDPVLQPEIPPFSIRSLCSGVPGLQPLNFPEQAISQALVMVFPLFMFISCSRFKKKKKL